jgi:RNA polymerase sigma-70 factor, ECF subfamily
MSSGAAIRPPFLSLSSFGTGERSPLSATNTAAAVEFDAIYRRLHPSLFRYLERLTGDTDVAEDIAQESFVRLLSRPDLSGEGVRLWLFTVATNLVRDRGRSTARRARLLEAVPVEPGRFPTPEEELERGERVRSVRAALAQLAERDVQMLLMREEGFRYAEIADAVGVAPGSVGTLVARALKRFVEVYRPNEGLDVDESPG